jgi:hypothetical protein
MAPIPPPLPAASPTVRMLKCSHLTPRRASPSTHSCPGGLPARDAGPDLGERRGQKYHAGTDPRPGSAGCGIGRSDAAAPHPAQPAQQRCEVQNNGLGLPISVHLAKAMQGTLTHATDPAAAESALLWWCRCPLLPLPRVARPTAAPQAMSRTPPNRLRILFVDGIALNRIIARAMLEHAGRTVDLAEDGATVLAGRTQTPLSAILTDRPDDARH